MFSSNNIGNYLLLFSVIAVTSYVGNKFVNGLEPKDNDTELIQKYLLNESALYGFNRPKIWIHSKYEINARKWRDFSSRNTTDLNQPYLHITIQTIINHCGNDFNICLIDDNTFSKLLPDWNIDLDSMAEPFKSYYRQYGLLCLLHKFGGMVLPNSLLCLKNMHSFFTDHLSDKKPFVCENINHTSNSNTVKIMRFIPDTYIMGCKKNDSTVKEMIDLMQKSLSNPHFSNLMEFRGDVSQWCLRLIHENKMNLVSGEYVGVKTPSKKCITIEELFEDNPLDLSPEAVAIYIPGEEILTRTKYQWFAVLSRDEIVSAKLAICEHIRRSMLNANDEYYKTSKVPSVISI